MVKNIPTIERSTKIRFGKNTTDDQGENTIVLNASNTAINASSGGSLYISPVRLDTAYASKPTVVLMMYNTETKELVESGERASDLIGNQGLAAVTNQGNVTSNVVSFVNNTTALVTQSNVGIANSTPGHTLSVGSNLYVDDTGSNVLVVSGGVRVTGDLDVIGNVTAITSNNLVIEDAIIELGKNNTSGDLILDLGLIMGRPDSNVTVGFKEETKEIILAFTESSAYSNTIVPLTSEDINVHVYGRLYTEANVGVLNTNPIHTLDVGSNLFVDDVGSNILVVTGNTNITGDLTVDTDTLHVDAVKHSVGIETLTPSANLHVSGNAYVSSNVTTDGTLTLNNPTTALVTDLASNVDIKVDQLYNVNLDTPLADQILVYDGTDWVNEYPIHTYIKIRNDLNGVNINAGDAVYVKGTHNSNILNVGLAQSNSPSTMPCIGLSNQLLTPGQQGTAVAYGKALSVVTDTFLVGETVYVSNTVPGGLSNVKPYNNDLIQNIGVVTKIHASNGGVFVTGIGRANDIPNAPIVADETDINYVYVNNVNNDLKKILPTNLLTQLQTLQQVTDTGNTTSNTIQFTNATTGIITTGNVEVGSKISVAGLTENKFPVVGAGNFLEDSLIGKQNGTIIISSDLQILGNVTVVGNSYVVDSNSLVINDRIIGIANNNAEFDLDIGIIMEYPGKNIGIIHHGAAVGPEDPHDYSVTIGYTQNTFTDNHVFNDSNVITVEILGNLISQNNITVQTGSYYGDGTTLTGLALLSNFNSNVSRIGVLETDLTDNASRIGVLETDLTDNASRIGVLETDLTDNASRIGVLETDLTDNASRIGVLETDLTDNASRIGVLETDLTDNASRIGVLETDLTDNASRIGVLETDLTDNASRIGVLETDLTDNASRIGVLETDLTDNASRIGVLETDLTDNASRIGVLETDLTDNASRIGVLETDLTDNASRIGVLETDLTDNASRIGVLETDLTSNAARVGALETDKANLADPVFTNDITVSGDAAVGSANLDATLHVTGNAFVSANLEVGASALYVDTVSATSNVGVGTATPGYSLDIVGDLNFSGSLYQGGSAFGGSPWNTETSPDALNYTAGNVGIGAADPEATLDVTGNVFVSSNVNVGANVFIAGGLVTNTGGVTKKTYSFTGDLDSGQTIANSTIKLTFTAHVFYAKVVAHLVESDDEVSTLSLECGGGHWTGGTPLNVAIGPISIFGSASTNPWDSTVTLTTTTIAFKPTTDMAVAGHYNVFIEYISASAAGAVTKITEGSTDVITFGY
jgi:hypothetical protein